MKTKISKNILSIILINVFLLQAGCSAAANTGVPKAPAGNGAPTYIQPFKVTSGIVAEGSVVPVQNVTLGFTSPGVVEEIFYKEGDCSHFGQAG